MSYDKQAVRRWKSAEMKLRTITRVAKFEMGDVLVQYVAPDRCPNIQAEIKAFLDEMESQVSLTSAAECRNAALRIPAEKRTYDMTFEAYMEVSKTGRLDLLRDGLTSSDVRIATGKKPKHKYGVSRERLVNVASSPETVEALAANKKFREQYERAVPDLGLQAMRKRLRDSEQRRLLLDGDRELLEAFKATIAELEPSRGLRLLGRRAA